MRSGGECGLLAERHWFRTGKARRLSLRCCCLPNTCPGDPPRRTCSGLSRRGAMRGAPPVLASDIMCCAPIGVLAPSPPPPPPPPSPPPPPPPPVCCGVAASVGGSPGRSGCGCPEASRLVGWQSRPEWLRRPRLPRLPPLPGTACRLAWHAPSRCGAGRLKRRQESAVRQPAHGLGSTAARATTARARGALPPTPRRIHAHTGAAAAAAGKSPTVSNGPEVDATTGPASGLVCWPAGAANQALGDRSGGHLSRTAHGASASPPARRAS